MPRIPMSVDMALSQMTEILAGGGRRRLTPAEQGEARRILLQLAESAAAPAGADGRGTVTVTWADKKFTLAYSKVPGQKFGPYTLPEVVRALNTTAALEPAQAQALILAAAASDPGTATAPVG